MLPRIPTAVLYHSGDSATLCNCDSCYSILFIVFLSFCHSRFLITVGFYCLMTSDHCLFLWVSVWFCSFHFLNSAPPKNCCLCVLCTQPLQERLLVQLFSYVPLFWAEFPHLGLLCHSQGYGSSTFLSLS